MGDYDMADARTSASMIARQQHMGEEQEADTAPDYYSNTDITRVTKMTKVRKILD